MDEDEIVVEAQDVVKAWQEAVDEVHIRVQALLDCGKDPNSAASQLPRLNAMVQDRLGALRSLMLRLELLAQQHPSEEESEQLLLKLEEWKEQEKAIRSSLRSANIRAKIQIDQAVKDERELLLAGGEEASLRQRRLQTKAGMTAATESITESLRRTRQIMVQEAERGVNTLAALDASNITLRKADLEYKGHRSLLTRTRNLLTTLQRQDVKDRMVMILGVLCFILVCYYIFNKRIGLLKMRREGHLPQSAITEELPDYADYPAGRPFAGVGPGSALGPGTAYTSPIMEPYPAALRFTCASHFTRPLLPTLEAPTCGRTGLGEGAEKHDVVKSLSLEDINNELVDLERIPITEVFQQLKCTPKGLSSDEATSRLAIFGFNRLEEKKEYKILKFLGFMWNPLSWVMEAAALVALIAGAANGKHVRHWDWQDFFGIILLLFVNSTISFIEENNAGNAAAALMARLAPKAKVLRDGTWSVQDASILVPGDIISIKLGDIIPADGRLLEGDPLKIDQSALTGESLPVTKKPGDEVYSGSTCKQGEIDAVVIATGLHTFFGKAAHLVDSTNQVGHFQKVLASIGNFCIVSIFFGVLVEILGMFAIQHRKFKEGVPNLLVLLIGGIPIAMPTVLSVTMAIGSHRLAQQGAITKRMTAIEEMAGMDVLCSDKTGTLTLNKLTVDKNLIEVFGKGTTKDLVVLMAARAARTENQDAIDGAIVNMLADPKEARAGIQEVHFLPFNPVDKRTAITYINSEDGKWWRASKGAPEQILELASNKEEISSRVHKVIDEFAERGLRALGVAMQAVPEKSKESPGGPWVFLGLMPLFDPPRHDSAETIRQALNLGVNVKMITGDQLAIAKETGRRLGMGVNMYPSSSLLGKDKDETISSLPIEELIEAADGFAGVFPEHKYEIVKRLQGMKHICGMTGDGVNDAPALKKADIGIAVSDATDAARSASDIVLTEPGLSVIISAVLTSRAIFQRMKNYTIYAVSITIRIVLGFLLLTLIWRFDFNPFMVLIIAVLNDGTIMTIAKDRVKPSPQPDSWKLKEIFATGIVMGTYMALITVLFYYLIHVTNFFSTAFHVPDIKHDMNKETSAVYLQVSIVSQALIFVTRSRGFSYFERPGTLLLFAFAAAQLIATLITAEVTWNAAGVRAIKWRWAGVIWLYSIIFYIPLDFIKLAVRYVLSGAAWNLMLEHKTAFTTHKDFGKEERQAQWALAQRTLHGLGPPDGPKVVHESRSYKELSDIAEQAKRRAEIARLRELHTLKGHVESVVRLKQIDISTIASSYTV